MINKRTPQENQWIRRHWKKWDTIQQIQFLQGEYLTQCKNNPRLGGGRVMALITSYALYDWGMQINDLGLLLR